MIANPFRWSFRLQCFAGFAVCALLIGYALFLQFNAHLEPCPLCIFQRIAFAALGLVFLLAGLHAPRGNAGRRAWGVLGLLAAATGIGIAGRHVWLQHLPADQVPMCGPGLDFLTEAMPAGGQFSSFMPRDRPRWASTSLISVSDFLPRFGVFSSSTSVFWMRSPM